MTLRTEKSISSHLRVLNTRSLTFHVAYYFYCCILSIQLHVIIAVKISVCTMLDLSKAFGQECRRRCEVKRRHVCGCCSHVTLFFSSIRNSLNYVFDHSNAFDNASCCKANLKPRFHLQMARHLATFSEENT